MKEFDIWKEGFNASPVQNWKAERLTSDGKRPKKAHGKNFKEACRTYIKRHFLAVDLDKGVKYPAIWGCRLWENEKDARKRNG